MSRWFRPRTLCLPTWRTWLLLCLTVLPAALWAAGQLHPWLSVTDPVADARYVVVEGWVPDRVVQQALDWARKHDAKLIFTTGIPFDQGSYLSNYPTFAEMCADTLKRMGADPAKVKPAPAVKVNLERTRAMATGLKQTLDTMTIPPGERKLNLFTHGTHAFRSRMLFQRALGPSWQVGVVSVAPAGYMPGAWWHYSEGIKSVIEELIAIVGQSMSL